MTKEVKKPETGEFDALITEIGVLQKSLPKPLAKGLTADGETDEERAAREQQEAATRMGKALEVTLADGTKVEAFDGGLMLKSFAGGLRSTQSLLGKHAELMGEMAKSLTVAREQLDAQAETIKAQAATIKELEGVKSTIDTMQKSLDTLANVGKGRKSATVLMPTVEGQEPKGLAPREFLLKALEASRKAGSGVTGTDVAHAEACINGGHPVPPKLVASVIAAVG